MHDHRFEILDADGYVHVFLRIKVLEIFDMDGDGRFKWLLQNLLTVHDLFCKACKDGFSIFG